MIEKGLVSTTENNQQQTAHSYYEEAARLGNANAVLLLGLKNGNQTINQ